MRRVHEKRRYRSGTQRVDSGTREKLAVAVAATVLAVALAAPALADSSPPRPSDTYAGLSAYVEVVPTAAGGSATSKPDVGTPAAPSESAPSSGGSSTHPAVSAKSAADSKLLKKIATSPRYGAPPSAGTATAAQQSKASVFGTGLIVVIAALVLAAIAAVAAIRRRSPSHRA